MSNFVARQPIVVRLIIVIAIVAISRIAGLLGWIPADWVASEDQVQDGIAALAGLWAAWSSRRAVTPVAAPKDNLRRELVPGDYRGR